jgi:hypothetical protein
MIDHIHHIEDLVLFEGITGAHKTLNYLWNISKGQANISTKWDGAPSIFAGWDDDGFFVSTKSFLNKSSVRYRNHNDVQFSSIKDEQLKIKLYYCLEYLEQVVPKGIILQGDLMWYPGALDVDENEEYVLFHPNTLIYGIHVEKFKSAWKMGVVWHSWISKNGSVSHPQFGNILSNDKVFSIDPTIVSYDIDIDNKHIQDVEDKLEALDEQWLQEFSENEFIPGYMSAYYNDLIRREASACYNELGAKTWIYQKHMIKTEKYKTVKNREIHTQIAKDIYDFLDNSQLKTLIEFQEAVRVVKQIVINRLNTQSKVKTWYKTNDGLVPTAHEGYVVIGNSEKLKLVDRRQFSYLNFSPNILKGWEPTRK